MDKEKIREYLATLKISYDRGGSLTNLVRNVVMFAMAFKVYNIPTIFTIVLAVGISVGFIGIGYLDTKYGIFSKEQETMTGKINPHLKKVSDDLAEIKQKLNISNTKLTEK